MNIEIGKPAPPFKLQNQSENLCKLEDYKGNWLVLYFYPKDNTPGCSLEGIEFSAAKESFEALNAKVIGVSADSCKSHQRFIEKKELTVELLSDPEKTMLEAYGVWQEKSMYGKTFMGVVRTTVLVDPGGEIAHIWPKVKVKGHVESVLETLKSLQ